MKHTIKGLNRFEIFDEKTKLHSYGFNQEWYFSKWKKKAGCGPTVASSLTLYLFLTQKNPTKEQLNNLHNTMWKYVKPTWTGISTIQKFKGMYQKFTDIYQYDVAFQVFDVNKKSQKKQEVELINFVINEIDNNHPIAFLNRDNGNQKNLESWHWTIIVGYESIKDDLVVEVIDNGKMISINISQWFRSTKLGGGCVSVFRKKEQV